jgi:hypothetical protein
MKFKTKNELNFKIGSVWSLFCLVFMIGCSEPGPRIEKKLENILQEDLEYMVAELKADGRDSSILEKPYYKVRDIRLYKGDSSRIFRSFAEVGFYYLKGVEVCQVRKYRYWTTRRTWDRFYKAMVHCQG